MNKWFKWLIYPIVFLGFLFPVKANGIIDSLEARLAKTAISPDYILLLSQLSHHNSRIDLEKSFEYLKIADSLSNNLVLEPEYQGAIYSSYTTAHSNKGNHTDAIIYGKKALAAYLVSNDSSQIANSFYQLSSPYMNMGQWVEAQEYLLESTKIFDMLGDQASLANSLNSLGAVMKELQNYKNAEEYYLRSLDIYRKLDRKDGMANVLNNLGNLEGLRNQYDKALVYYKEQEVYDKEANFQWGLGYVYESMSNLYVLKKEYNTALQYVEQSLEIRKALGHDQEIMISTLKYASVLEHLDRYSEALNQYKLGIGLASALESDFWIAEGNKGIAAVFASIDEYDMAYEAIKSYALINDSLLGQKTIDAVANLEIKYQTEQKEQEISLLETEKSLATKTLSGQKKVTAITLGAGGILALLSIFLFKLLQQNKKQKIQLQQSVKDKDYLLREIHHRVKNNLQVISSLLYLQSEKLTDPVAQDAINVGRGRVKSMALIHQNLYAIDQSSQISLKKYLEDLAVELFDSYNLHGESIDLVLSIEDVMVDVEILVPLGLIINELISNALKYAYVGKEEGILKISAATDGRQLNVQVKDNGIGMDLKNKREGSFGTELVESFVDQLNADMNIISEEGIEVNIELPLNQAA
ncbi:MAG: two-component sensor histidine kinase [Saprospiraceae bacterium]|jgi:two-component sensor histidine kinase